MATHAVNASKPDLTNKEISLLVAVVKHNSEEPKVNWNVIADEVGYKEGRNARDMFKKLKTKIGAEIKTTKSASTLSHSPSEVESTLDYKSLCLLDGEFKKIKEEIVEDQDDDLDDDDIAPLI